MAKRLDPVFVQREITQLLLDNPELAEDEVLRADMIEGSTDAHAFLSQVTRSIQACDATARGISEYLEDLKERRDRMERREQSLRSLVFKVLQTAELRKAELPEATIDIRNGPAKVVVVNEQEVPDQYMRIRKEPNKTLIKQSLQSGEDVPGCALSNAEPVLHIRVK